MIARRTFAGLYGSAYVIVRIMVSIKEATLKAVAFARDALGPERAAGVRLEEVESTMAGNEEAWLITLSMIAPDEAAGLIGIGNAMQGALTGKFRRDYKTFTVLKSNVEVKSMKIRELADA